jgi:adenylosuccinate lyase
MVACYENVALWHERDISHSSVERVAVPDATILLDYMLQRMAGVVEKLRVRDDRMRANLDLTHGLVHSQRLLLMLIETGMSRELAYDLVQPLAMRAWEEQRSFLDVVLSSEEMMERLSESEIREAFDPEYHLRQVDAIFERVGL